MIYRQISRRKFFSKIYLWTVLCLFVLISGPIGYSTDPVEQFEIKGPTVFEMDRQGRVVWNTRDIQSPMAISVAPDGRRAIADKSGRIAVYSKDGTLLKNLEIPSPSDVDFLDNGNLLVTSNWKGWVREITLDEKVVWEQTGLRDPFDADRLPNGNTLITETGANRIIEVNPDHRVVWSFAEGLSRPIDAAWYGEDQIVVAEYNRGAVTCIGREYAFRWRFTQLNHPIKVHPLPDGSILVAEADTGMLLQIGPRRQMLERWKLERRLESIGFMPNGNLLVGIRPANPGISKISLSADLSTIPQIYLEAQKKKETGVQERKRFIPSPYAVPVLILLAAILFIILRSRIKGPWRWIYRIAIPGVLIFTLFFIFRESKPPVPGLKPEVNTYHDNIVLVLFDSLRKDHLPIYGYWRNTTPILQDLSRESLVFEQYITQAPWTKPSIVSLLTSTYPSNHGVVKQRPECFPSSSLITLGEALSDRGYYTAAVMENPHMSTEGFDQGFQDYRFVSPDKPENKPKLPGLTGDTALEVLKSRPKDQPFFLMVFFMNPHYPYKPNQIRFDQGINAIKDVLNYDSEIFEADEQVGRILKELKEQGVMDDTIFIFSSDHGEDMNDHGEPFHGKTLYDTTLNVPLIIRGVGVKGRMGGLVREIDLMPTLLDYVGVEPSPDCQWQMAGVSIRRFIEERASHTGLVAYAETSYDQNERRAKRTEQRKVIADLVSNTVEMYNMETDPQELNNLVTLEPEQLKQWSENQWKIDQQSPTLPIDPEQIKALKAVGYLGGE